MEFEEASYRCSTAELNNRIKKLIIVSEIIDSDLTERQKAEKLQLVYLSSESFRKSYTNLIARGEDDKRLDPIRDLLNNFYHFYEEFKNLEDIGLIEKKGTCKHYSKYVENYEYAKSIISLYIVLQDSYREYVFLRNNELTEEEFKYCAIIIKTLNPELYEKFLEKREINNRIRCSLNSKTIADLSRAIRTGKFFDGTEFELLEYIKRTPFKRSKNYLYAMIDFMKRNNPKDFATIRKFIAENGMESPTYYKLLDIDYFYDSKISVNGKEMTEEEKNLIFDYLKYNYIPCISASYRIVRDRVLKGEITKNMVLESREEYIQKKLMNKDKCIKKTLKMK